jgi:glucosylceramidase
MHSPAKISVTRTARDSGERLAALPALDWGVAPPTREPELFIMVDAGRTFQTIEGFGGAFTEAAAVTLHKLPAAKQAEILRAYFDPVVGHGYNLCRTHINSCDFSLGNYAYADQPGDFELKGFTLARDHEHLLPMIADARKLAGPGFKLFASPWSPPAWMKTNGIMNEGGKLRPECRDVWARYYCRYVVEMTKAGHPIWGLTVQNEPASAQRWDSCQYSAEEERDFVRDHLGPALHAAGLAEVKLIVWDHNRNLFYERVQPIYDDPAAARYVWGAGTHWYMNDCFDNVQAVHDRWPDKAILFTEGCQESGPHLGVWGIGERYARSMINDLNRWNVGWVDWNLLLDETGGPNHVNNLCSAPIIAHTDTGEVTYQTSYYYLGHFSRFIKAGARRIISTVTRDEAETTAFLNPDGTIALVVLNRTETSLPVTLRHAGRAARAQLPARSITTYLFQS